MDDSFCKRLSGPRSNSAKSSWVQVYSKKTNTDDSAYLKIPLCRICVQTWGLDWCEDKWQRPKAVFDHIVLECNAGHGSSIRPHLLCSVLFEQHSVNDVCLGSPWLPGELICFLFLKMIKVTCRNQTKQRLKMHHQVFCFSLNVSFVSN